ncbi:SDR family NAD(P)-dependent oxidoreductase [Paenibacillus solisilvae]|uniref:SDR family NAD(P)-dependent oxidoreductase n=1 Tax=Paenibacillus solisilvae TaxID=2486751 RepID=A0ABW0W7V9_9BACL
MNIWISGANRGLGYEAAAEAIRRGHSVIACCRNPQKDGERLYALQDHCPGRVVIAELSITDEAMVEKHAAQLQEQGTRIDAIINNAAVLVGREHSLEELQLDNMRSSFEINVFAPMNVVKHLLPFMKQRADESAEPAVIMNVSSEAGSIHHAYGGDYPYAMSKAALNMFSQQLRSYVEARGIHVYSVHPGWMRTDMGGANAPTDPADSARGMLDLIEQRVEAHTRLAFIDYLGRPMDI